MTDSTEKWFASWFDTSYYHILYKERNDAEAEAFMETLTTYLNISDTCEIMDLACGKGRHSIYLNSIGYNVTGADLSPQSIAHAKQYENDRLKFAVHDMSLPFDRKFNAVFNLFTSFGYFEDDQDNLNTIKAIKGNLKDKGVAVIDFMNIDYVIANLVSENSKTVDGITFNLKRYVEKGYLVKDISFTADGKDHHYQERVKVITIDDFKIFFEKAGATLIEVFGDYKLNTFNRETSKRLVLIFM